MKQLKTSLITCCLFFCATNLAFAISNASIEFFASNNTEIIDMQTAYTRLTGDPQHVLNNTMIKIMQKNHVEQGRFSDVLGTYGMTDKPKITADNTEILITSPYQQLSDQGAFRFAKMLAIKLKQESVAVFIPNQTTVGDITVSFTSQQPSVSELLALLNAKLPPLYSQAFSLHLANTCGPFSLAKVAAIEWLGGKTNLKEVQKAFPQEQVNYRYGKAFFVYQDGKTQQF